MALPAPTDDGPILVIDDEKTICTFIALALEMEGHQVISTTSPVDGLGLAGTLHPSLILVDFAMPLMNGRQFLNAYRATPGPHAPAVLVTAATDAELREAPIPAEFVLHKPFGLNELIAVVDRYAHRVT